MTASAKGLFQAMRPKRASVGAPLLEDAPTQRKAKAGRRAHDFYPTAEPEAVRALLKADGDRIRRAGTIWEPACGDGAMVKVLRSAGFPVCASDIVDRGCPDSWIADFFTCIRPRGNAIITNPPYGLITARDGAGKWLKHTLAMPDWTYCALLLDWNWPAGRINGLGELLDRQPFSWTYLLRWKLDFTGEGQAPQRNAWFVWARDDPRATDGSAAFPDFRWLDRDDDHRQAELFHG